MAISLQIKFLEVKYYHLTFSQAPICASGRTRCSNSAFERRRSVSGIRRQTSGGNLVHALQEVLRRRRGSIVVVHGILRRNWV